MSVFLPWIPVRSSRPAAYFLGGPGNVDSGCECGRGGEVRKKEERRKSAKWPPKQPASTVEERRLVFNNASRSAVTLGKASSTVLLFSSSCPWYSWGGLASDHNLLPRVPLIEWGKNENGAGPSLPGLRGKVVHLC